MRHFIALIFPIALLGCASTLKMKFRALLLKQRVWLRSKVGSPIRLCWLIVKISKLCKSRLRKLNEAGVAQNNYSLAKAQCWLDTAKTQYHENDRTGYIEESMTESQKIIQALEANKTAKVGYDTPLVARSTRLRDDLWAELTKFKNNSATLVCNARTVACAEVRLVRAGHAEQQTGWRAATPHVMMVEDGLRRASRRSCELRGPCSSSTRACSSNSAWLLRQRQ